MRSGLKVEMAMRVAVCHTRAVIDSRNGRWLLSDESEENKHKKKKSIDFVSNMF